jgi:hypothetical protein
MAKPYYYTIEVFKMFKGMDNLDVHKFFQLTNAPTRGHSLKVVKHGCNLDIRKFSFSHRVVNTWNSLSEDIVACDSINSFKAKLDEFLACRGFIKALLKAFFPHNLTKLN